jgi:hypothetical protein
VFAVLFGEVIGVSTVKKACHYLNHYESNQKEKRANSLLKIHNFSDTVNFAQKI